jgi:hypothetical protein
MQTYLSLDSSIVSNTVISNVTVSDVAFESDISTLIDSQNEFVSDALTNTYVLYGQEALDSVYNSARISVEYLVTYKDGSTATVNSIVLNDSVANITFIPTLIISDSVFLEAPIVIPLTAYTQFISLDSNIIKSVSGNVFAPQSSGSTYVTASIIPNTGSTFIDSLDIDALRIPVIVSIPPEDVCVDAISVNDLPLFDVDDLVSGWNHSLQVYSSEGPITSYVTISVNDSVMEEHLTQMNSLPPSESSEFSNQFVFSGRTMSFLTSANDWEGVVLNGTSSSLQNISLEDYFTVTYDTPSCDAVSTTVDFSLSPDACYYAVDGDISRNVYFVNNVDAVSVYRKCEGTPREYISPDNINLVANITKLESSGGSCTNTQTTGNTNCYRVTQSGTQNMSVYANGVFVDTIILNAQCAYSGITMNALETDVNVLSLDDTFTLTPTLVCKPITGCTDVSLSSFTTSVSSGLAVTDDTLTLAACGADQGSVSVSNAPTNSFCSELSVTTSVGKPLETIRSTKCSPDPQVYERYLDNHIYRFLNASSFTLENGALLQASFAGNSSIKEIYHDIFTSTAFKNFVINELTVDLYAYADGSIDKGDSNIFGNVSPNDITFIRSLSLNSSRASAVIPKSVGDSTEYTTLYDFRKAALDGDLTQTEFQNRMDAILSSSINAYCSNTFDQTTLVHKDLFQSTCSSLISWLIFDPGMHVSSDDVRYCYVDFDATDSACCPSSDMCVYGNTCYAAGNISDVDGDGILEVCS